MPRLKADIEYVQLSLRKKGIGYGPLLAELTDHVICEAENEMKNGLPFKMAVDKTLSTIQSPELNSLQNKTIKSDNYSPPLMIKNIARMFFRNLVKNKKHAVINLFSLSLGIASFITITLFVIHEITFDQIFSNSSSIYRITMSSTVGNQPNFIPTSYPAIAPELQNQFEDIKKYVRIINYKYSRLIPTFKVSDRVFYEENVIFADSTFFQLFDFPFLEGNPKTALIQPGSVVITKRIAEKYFGNEKALGKRIQFNNKTDLEIAGVLQDLPSQTHLQFDFIIPMTELINSEMFRNNSSVESWSIDWFWTYMLIPDPRAVSKIETGINVLADSKIPDYRKENDVRFYLQKLEDVHLYSEFDYNTDFSNNGDIRNLYIFIGIGALILMMSCINFINLSIATATGRYKEIGVSKVMGALRTQLQFQFVFESVVVAMVSLIIAYLILQLLLPLFSILLSVDLSIQLFSDWILVLGSIGFTILIGIVSGIYPAFFVSSFDPKKVLNGIWRPGSGRENFRKILVGVQLGISVFLIVGTLVIFSQREFIQHKSLGYDKEQILMLPIRGTAIVKNYHAFKNTLLGEASIQNVSSVSEPVGREVQFMSFKIGNNPQAQFVKILNVTYDFTNTMGLEVIQGRDFSREFATDSTSGFVINEAALKAFGWDNAIGKPLDHAFRETNQGHVIGVVKDFNFEPLHKKVDPIIIWFGGAYWYAAVKIQPGQAKQALDVLEKVWKKFETEKPFAFSFLDQSIQHVYEKEKRLSEVFLVFAILSILMSMMGLYGLVAFAMDQRLREIGIRKVLGASVRGILNLVTKDYMVLVIIAFLIAAPFTYWIMNNWLGVFAFRISLGPMYFSIALLTIGVLVFLTIFSRIFDAANSNPTNILRNE